MMTVSEIERPEPVLPKDLRADIRELMLSELQSVLTEAGQPPYRARQITRWLWTSGVESFDAMRDLPATLRVWLQDHFAISLPSAMVANSADDTRKLLLSLGDREAIESVIIPSDGRMTLCLSTQVGCAMGCEFCATARMGLHRNLTAAEIASQILAARRELRADERLTNFVFMGMGEPLANYSRLARALKIMTSDWGLGISPRRITVSTVGLIPGMKRLLTEFPVNLAVSLHATTDEARSRMIPLNRRYNLAELLETSRGLPIAPRARITFEYVMLKGINDSPSDTERLLRMLRPLRAKVNLLVFNPFPGAPYEPSSPQTVERFQARLLEGALTATVRRSRGQDIAAACGQLYADSRARMSPS